MANWKPYVTIVMAKAMYSGMSILSKAAFSRGMNTSIFVFYRQTIATLVFVPFAAAATRRGSLPQLRPKVLFSIFMLALFGITINLNVYSTALKFTSATVGSATSNCTPVFTLLISVLLGAESIRFKSSSGIAKVFGLALCVCGVMVIALYKGPQLSLDQYDANSNGTWIYGSILMLCSTLLWSMEIVFQGMILKEYPSSLMFTTISCLFSAIQSFLVAIAAERERSKWKLHWDQDLLAVAYSGIFVAGIAAFLTAWCNSKKGPVFAAMFTPVSLVVTVACSSLLLGEALILGSALGGALMVGGLYSVLWGKRREFEDNMSDEEGSGPFLNLN